MSSKTALLLLHISVFLFGSAGLFAAILPISSLYLVFSRVSFGLIGLWSYQSIRDKKVYSFKRNEIMAFIPSGLVLVFHWYFFFQSIKVLSVSTGLFLYATFPVFSALLEFIFFKEKINRLFLITFAITISGLVLINFNNFSSNHHTIGFVWGILSGFSFAVLSLLNRQLVQRYSSPIIAMNQFLISVLMMLPLVIILPFPVLTFRSIFLLMILGLIFTGLSHSLFIVSLKKITVKTASIISCLEPIYGSILAIILLKEQVTINKTLGGLLIISSAFMITIHNSRNQVLKTK